MKEEMKIAALESLRDFKTMGIGDLPAVIETIKRCYYTDSAEDSYLRDELQYFIEGLKK